MYELIDTSLPPGSTDHPPKFATSEGHAQDHAIPRSPGLPASTQDQCFTEYVEKPGVNDKKSNYTFLSSVGDASSSNPVAVSDDLGSCSDVGGQRTPMSTNESSQHLEGLNTPILTNESIPHLEITPILDDARTRWDIRGDPGSKIAEFNAELLNENGSAPNVNDYLSPVAKDAIRGGRVPEIRKSSLSPEPSETEITDNGNYLHTQKIQNQKIALSDQIRHDEYLGDRLLNSLKETPGYPDRKGFFPRDLLEIVIDVECVFRELKDSLQHNHTDDTIKKYAKIICGVPEDEVETGRPPPVFRKIFVSLVLIEKTSTILKFLEDKVTDGDLPLSKIYRPGNSSGIFTLARRGTPNIKLSCFEGWRSVAIKNFEQWQWTTVSPFFAQSRTRKHVIHFVLQDQAQLPFLSDSRRKGDNYEKLEYDGGFSHVFKVTIHPAHHDFEETKVFRPLINEKGSLLEERSSNCFAVKCLLSRDKEDFNKEVEMLKRFSAYKHTHLISLLATYEQFQKFYLLFHWAEGDLQDYWQVIQPKPPREHKTTVWVAEQCFGIAGGLSLIHHYDSSSSKAHLALPTSPMDPIYGRHGDIKPANVLLFLHPTDPNHMGILKLTDFGLAEFSTLQSKSNKPKTNLAISPAYRPPECDLQGGKVGPSYDIWTLGCLYLEFITWLLGGWDLVDCFTKERTSYDLRWGMPMDNFFEIVECAATNTKRAVIKRSVVKFICKLHAHENCNEYIHRFLDLIVQHMMIIKPDDLNIRGRLSCPEVERKLRIMLEECREHPEKMLRKSPRESEYDPSLCEAVGADILRLAIAEVPKRALHSQNGVTHRRVNSLGSRRSQWP